jgi:TPP-dependent indolepyruvate ferredoxin oxidoreductase alpha subunit
VDRHGAVPRPRRYKHTKLPNGVAVWDRSRLDETRRVLAATRGVTVLIHDQERATEKRRKRKRLDGDCPAFMTVVPRASGGGRARMAGTITADELPARTRW